MKRTLILLSLCALLLSGCGGAPAAPAPGGTFDPRGAWQYVLTADNGNTYDAGTITFRGEAAAGSYVQINIYNVEYEGEYSFRDGVFSLQGDQVWSGAFIDSEHMRGSFESSDGVRGVWEATRQP